MDSVASKPTVLDEIAAHERSEFTRSFDELKKEAAKKEKARMEEENRLMWPHLYKEEVRKEEERKKAKEEAAVADRQRRELIKRIKVVFEDEGREFGPDPTDANTLANRFRVATNLREKRIEEVFQAIRRARDVQLCFVVDLTGSMTSHLNGVRTSILDIVRKLTDAPAQGKAEAQSMSLGFVAYRDYGDTNHYQAFPFTSDVAAFTSFLGSIGVSGGGDAEDGLGGLDTALNLRWSEACGTKVIFHIGDMPCHGSEFQRPGFGDSYPNGDPSGGPRPIEQCKAIFARLRAEGIQYHFGKITEETNVMIEKFSEIYGEPIVEFDVQNAANILDAVYDAVSMSISASISASKQTVGVVRAVRPLTLDSAKPNWTTIREIKGTLVSYEFPASIQDLIDDVPLERNKPKSAIVKIAPNPFGKGAERFAFYGKDVSKYVEQDVGGKNKSPDSAETVIKILKKDAEIVLKEYLHVGKGMNSARRYELSNQMQTISSYLAQEFCKDLKDRAGITKTIKFIKIRTLYLNTSPPRYMSCEKVFAASDNFIRFTNNTNYAIMNEKALKAGVSKEFVELVVAFSHWTYKATSGYLMVVDLEGVVGRIGGKGQTGVLLTDPAIHCTDVTRYGPMNHSIGGMKNFFATHKCNQFCNKLGLQCFAT